MKFPKNIPASFLKISLLGIAASLSACNDNDLLTNNVGGDHEHERIESSGRLVFSESSTPARAHVYDIDSGKIIQSFDLDFAASAIYASPNFRYAAILQRTNDQTRFIDGGLWTEDHSDHLHDYKADPLLMSYILAGTRPTHYEAHGQIAALFLDGLAATATTPAIPAGVSVFSDASLGRSGTDKLEASLTLPTNIHGTAEPRGQWLLTVYRDPASTTTLPSEVELYKRDGNSYTFSKRLPVSCPGLHGSYSNAGYTVFGCTDGVLAVEQVGDDFTAKKISNPATITGTARIGTLIGNRHLPDFVGFAGSDLYAIDPSAGTMSKVDWAAGEVLKKSAHAMDAKGRNFMILDSRGTLTVLDPLNKWASKGTIISAVSNVATAPTPAPVITVSQSDDEAYITDPSANSIAVIDLAKRAVNSHISLGFAPVGLAWLGLGKDEH